MALFLLMQAKNKTRVVQGQNGEYLESDISGFTRSFLSSRESPGIPTDPNVILISIIAIF
jgi:hypothetical protein